MKKVTMNAVEAYEALGTLKTNGVKLLDSNGKLMRDWNINSVLEVSKVKLEFCIPADGNEPNRFFDVWLSVERFLAELPKLRLHDSITADVVVVSEGETVVRDGKADYKPVRVDEHDVILTVVENSKVSERRNKPFNIRPVKVIIESEDDEADE